MAKYMYNLYTFLTKKKNTYGIGQSLAYSRDETSRCSTIWLWYSVRECTKRVENYEERATELTGVDDVARQHHRVVGHHSEPLSLRTERRQRVRLRRALDGRSLGRGESCNVEIIKI